MSVEHLKDYDFKSGQSGNLAGRPKGSVGGRALLLARFDKFLAEKTTAVKIEHAWKRSLNADAAKFWREEVVPLLPKEMLVRIFGQMMMGQDENIAKELRAIREVLATAAKEGKSLDSIQSDIRSRMQGAGRS